jgi:hypothetical protein
LFSTSPSEIAFSIELATGGVTISQVPSVDGSLGTDDDIQARTILWLIRNDPNLPDGAYFLDTCTGKIRNMLARPVGTLAGLWGQDHDC